MKVKTVDGLYMDWYDTKNLTQKLVIIRPSSLLYIHVYKMGLCYGV